MEKVSELYISKYGCKEKAQAALLYPKEILVELLRVKSITKKQYITFKKM